MIDVVRHSKCYGKSYSRNAAECNQYECEESCLCREATERLKRNMQRKNGRVDK